MRESAADEHEIRKAAQPRKASAQRGKRTSKKKGDHALLKVLGAIALVFATIFGAIGKLFSSLNRRLDVFRKGEVSTAIVNSIVGGVVVVVLLLVFTLLKPGIDSSRAQFLAARGNAVRAVRIVHALEADEYPAEKLKKTRAGVAEGLIKSGCHEEASALISEMEDGAQKDEFVRSNNYHHARNLYEEGDYTAAAQLFYQLDSYQDSALRYADCRCALAVLAMQEGNETSARSLLLDVPEVVDRVKAAAKKVAGSDEGAQAILAAPLFSEANLTEIEQTMQELTAARSDMPEGRIAAGWHHTLGLRADGTVLAVGENIIGQCDVGAWSGITQVAAGAYHSVGLREDGTVLAVGDNSQGQCEVSTWTDIVAIAAATADTIGLKADGSVVACGLHADKVSGWRNVAFITGGSYSIGALDNKGAMLASHTGAQMEMGTVLYDLSVCGPVSVGVLYDGTMVSTFDGAPQWEGIVSATACESGILAIDVDGRVLSHFYRESDAVEFNVPGSAVEVESGGTHHVVLCEDGRVYAFGNNDYGQCAVNDWQL